MISIETILEDFGEQLIKDLRAALLKEGVGYGGDHPSQTTHQTVSPQPRVRTQIIKGPYFNSGSTNTGVPASKPPAYPTHQLPKFNVKL